MPKRVKIRGMRGRWVAEVEGRMLAVLHHTQRVGTDRYHADIRSQDLGTKRLAELEQALRENDLVVIQRDKDPVSLARDGYIGIFHFADLIFDPDEGLKLTFTGKYAEPA